MILLGWALYRDVRQILITAVDETLHDKLQIFTGLIHEEHGRLELEVTEIIAGEYAIPHSGHYYRITSGDRTVAVSRSLVDRGFEFPQLSPVARHKHEIHYTSRGPAGKTVRVLRYQYPTLGSTFDITLVENLEDHLHLIAAFQQFLLFVLPLSILSLCLTGWWIARNSLRPLAAFSSTIRTITHKNLAERIDLGMTAQELTVVAGSFNDMLDRLHQAFESTKRLVADASHELKTPLSVIMAQCDVTLQRTRTPEEHVAALRNVRESAQQITRLVNDLLSLARLDAGLLAAETFGPVPLRECVDHAVQMVGLLAESRKVRISAEIGESLRVCGSRTSLDEALVNLVENGVRYNREGGSVSVTAEERGPMVAIIVADTGIGIRESDLGLIFGRFYRADAVRGREGSGLGLSIVKSIAEAHGGTVEVESTLGAGSRFIIVLPAGCAAE